MSQKKKKVKKSIFANIKSFVQKIKLPGLGEMTLYDLFRIYGEGIVQGTFAPRASSIAYSFFLALFPFLLFLLNLIPYLPIADFQERFLIFVENLLPPQTKSFFFPVIADIAVNPRSRLLSFAFLLTLILSANGVNAIFNAFKHSIYVKGNRKFFRQYLLSVGVAVLIAIIMLTSVGIILYGEYIIQDFKAYDIISNEVLYISILQFLIFALMIFLIISILYYYGFRKNPARKFLSIGAAVTTLLFLVMTYLFRIYINNFSNYNELYGSIGALLILMLYIWINANLLLFGFELEASIRKMKENYRTN